jgi:tRNA(adenine34) deaminase
MGAAVSFGIAQVAFALESPSDGASALFETWERRADLFPGYAVPAVTRGVMRSEARALFVELVARPGPRDGLWRWARHLAGSDDDPR